jgi:hypothetical protein
MRTSGMITLGFVTAFSLFNLQPYLGLRQLSCQTMYSGLSLLPPGNHLFLPRLRWSDVGDYFENARIAGDSPHSYLNQEFARAELQRRCADGQPVSFEFNEGGRSRRIADACADPEHSRPRHSVWRRFGYPATLGDPE